MKLVRPLLISLGVVALLGTVAIALAFTPAAQRWALLRAAAGRPNLHLQVDSVAAGPTRLVLRGVSIEQDGVRIAIDRLDADYSLFQLLFGSRLEMERVAATGLRVDASRVSRNRVMAGAVAAPAGVVQIRLPLEIVLGDLTGEGRAVLPGAAGRPTVQADFKVSGGHFAPGSEGTLRLRARLVDPYPGARVGALDLQAAFQLKQSLDRSFDRVGLTALLDATGPKISGQNQLKVVAELTRTLSGESYLLHVDTLSNGQAEDILVANARLPRGSRSFAGEWALTARSSQIEPFMIGGALPRFEARGTGTFAFDAASRELALRGSLQGAASELEALRPALRAIGPVSLTSEFDLAADRTSVHLNKLDVGVAGEQPVLDLHASGAVAFNLKERRLHFGGAAAVAADPATAGEFLRLKLTGVPVAWLRPFIAGADVSGGVVTGEIALVSSDGHDLVARTVVPLRADGLTVVRRGRTLASKAAIAVEAEAGLVPAGAAIRLRALTLTTPAGDSLKAQATITTPLQWDGPITVAGDFSADCPVLFSRWLPGDRVRVQGGGDVTVQPGRIDWRRLHFEADDGKGQRLAALALARAFSIDLERWRADTGPATVELARLNLGRLPIGLFMRAPAGMTLTGSTSPDEFVLKAEGEHLALSTTSPWLLADVTLTRGTRPVLDRVTLEFSPVVDLTGGVISRVASGDVLMRDGSGAPLAKFSAELARPDGAGLRAGASFNIDLPTLGAQPFFARGQVLSAGQANGEIRAATLEGGAVQIEARATLNGLVGRDGGQTLPVANLGIRGLFQPDGRFSVQAPVLLDSAGQRSDLAFSADGHWQPGGATLDARLAGGHIELGDVLLLASAAGQPLGSEDAESSGTLSRALSPPAADEQAFWTGWSGQLALDCKEVTWGHGWTMTGLNGRLEITTASVALRTLGADFGEDSKVSAHGELAFAPGLNPYAFTGDFALTEFDTGRFFKALDPDRAPTVEGICHLQGRLEGQGLTLEDTLDRTRGQFELTSRKGVFRGLKRATEKISMASKAVEWSAALGALLKTGKVKQAAERVAGNGYYVDQLAHTLAEWNYDQLSLKLERDQSMNVLLKEVTLVAPDIRLLGAGQVAYVPGKPLLAQPLSLALSFSSRGKIEQILGKLHLLDGTRDELDYARVKEPVVLGGTLARPDPLPYYAGLLSAKTGE